MRINEIKASLAASPAEASPPPSDQTFLSLGELLRRVQRTPDTTMRQAADCLLSWGLLMGGAPKIMVNSKTRGLIPADKQSEKLAIGRLEYVFHRDTFESDGGAGASTDYDLFGFDRKEFDYFLSNTIGEPLDLFSTLQEPTHIDIEHEPLAVPAQQAAPASEAIQATSALTAPASTKVKKLRTNTLDIVMYKAITLAQSNELAAVWLKLRELAQNEEQPFTGVVDKNGLWYTKDNSETVVALSKNAVSKRLKVICEPASSSR